MTRHRNDVDVLIVGAGPVGLCSALLDAESSPQGLVQFGRP
jgi:flavin-dependent dehydrogenase